MVKVSLKKFIWGKPPSIALGSIVEKYVLLSDFNATLPFFVGARATQEPALALEKKRQEKRCKALQ